MHASCVLVHVLAYSSLAAHSYVSSYQQPSVQSKSRSSLSRRDWFTQSSTGIISIAATPTTSSTIASVAAAAFAFPQLSNAAADAVAKPPSKQPDNLADDAVTFIKEGQSTLSILLENWDRATVDCTFADVPRELLETKNKELLLEKASTFALFDKSSSIETCKTSNRIVRDYLGVTGKGPLVGMDKRMRNALDDVDSDRLDDYLTEIELFSQYMSKATSLSYTAGTADIDSVNNFTKGDTNRNENSNLEQTRRTVMEAKNCMDRIIDMLEPVPSTATTRLTATVTS